MHVVISRKAMVLASTMASAKVQDPKMWRDVSTALRRCALAADSRDC